MARSNGSKSYEEVQGRASGKRSKAQEGAESGFISFWPTEAERTVLAADERSMGELLDELQEQVERGLQFKFGTARDKSSLYLTCRDGEAGYQEGVTIAVFHSSIQRAVLAMLYCLQVKWPDFPEKPPRVVQRQIEW